MFCRSFLLSTFIIFAVIFVSNLNAIKCNNFQLKKDVITQELHDGEECIGCTGYVCKINDGKILVGSACTETVKEICQQKWDDSMIQKIAKNDGREVVNDKYFTHSCQEDYCNTVHWLHDYLVEHDTNIASAGFPHYEHSLPEKVDLDDDHWICYDNDKKVPCNEIPPFQQIGLKHKNGDGNAKSPDMKVDDSYKTSADISRQKRYSKGDGWNCTWDFDNGYGEQQIPCYCIASCTHAWDVDKKFKYDCLWGDRVEGCENLEITTTTTPADDGNASIKYGYGFALIIASFFAYLFFH